MKLSKIATSILVFSAVIYMTSSYFKNKQLAPSYIYYPDGAVKGMTKPINDSITLYVVKSTVRLDRISGAKHVLLNDSLKLVFRLKNLEHPLIENLVYDFDSLFFVRDSTLTYSSKSASDTVVTFIKATKLGEQVARGLIQNYKVLYRRKNGAYATEAKHLYWSYKYIVKEH